MKSAINWIYLILISLSVCQVHAHTRLDSTIQQSDTQLHATDLATRGIVGHKKSFLMANEYRSLFSKLQNPATLRTLSDKDLSAMFDAAHMAAFYTHEARYLEDMHIDLDALEHRKLASDFQYAEFYRTLVAQRQFAYAREFLSKHKSIHVVEPPLFKSRYSKNIGKRSILLVDPVKNKVTRENINIKKGIQIVVIDNPQCHFVQNSERDFMEDASLRKIFKDRTIWLSPQDGRLSIPALQKWNRDHPDEKIVMVYHEANWPEIDYWGTPAFYFFKDGRLTAEVIGWPKGGNRKALLQAAKKVGINLPE